jgi:hypothetical protein
MRLLPVACYSTLVECFQEYAQILLQDFSTLIIQSIEQTYFMLFFVAIFFFFFKGRARNPTSKLLFSPCGVLD